MDRMGELKLALDPFGLSSKTSSEPPAKPNLESVLPTAQPQEVIAEWHAAMLRRPAETIVNPDLPRWMQESAKPNPYLDKDEALFAAFPLIPDVPRLQLRDRFTATISSMMRSIRPQLLSLRGRFGGVTSVLSSETVRIGNAVRQVRPQDRIQAATRSISHTGHLLIPPLRDGAGRLRAFLSSAASSAGGALKHPRLRHRMALPVIGLVLISALALAGFADELRSFFSAAPVTASRAVKPLSKEEILSKMEAASKGLLPGPAMLLVISTPPLQAVRIADPVTPRARRATAARRAR